MNKKKKTESGLKKIDRFQKLVGEMEKFQERLDNTDNPLNMPSMMSCMGHINYVIICLAEEMNDIKQKFIRLLGEDIKKEDVKEIKEKTRYFI